MHASDLPPTRSDRGSPPPQQRGAAPPPARSPPLTPGKATAKAQWEDEKLEGCVLCARYGSAASRSDDITTQTHWRWRRPVPVNHTALTGSQRPIRAEPSARGPPRTESWPSSCHHGHGASTPPTTLAHRHPSRLAGPASPRKLPALSVISKGKKKRKLREWHGRPANLQAGPAVLCARHDCLLPPPLEFRFSFTCW
jgi:hypothetical protein